MKKLCIILPHHWAFKMGGSEYQIKCLLESGLLTSEFDITIASKRVNEKYRPDGYHLTLVTKPFTLQRYGLIFDAPFLYRKLREISPDVIFQNIGTSYAGVAAVYARKAGCKMVLCIASDNDVVPFKRKNNIVKSIVPFIEKKAFEYGLRTAHHIIAQTELQKRLVRQYYGRKVDAVIRNFQPYPKEKIDKQLPVKVLWVANFKPLKQPEMFIRLAQDLYKKQIPAEFIMIGRPEMNRRWQDSLEARIHRLANITYLGGRTIDQVEQHFADAHLLVNTSLFEGFSNTFIQAWMRCVPVVSLNSNPDGLLKGKNLGFISGSYEQLRDDVVHLITNEKLRHEMGQQAQAYAMKHFSFKNVHRLVDILLKD